MDHKAFVAGIDPDLKVHLTQRSTGAGVLHLVGHLLVLVVGAVWITHGWLLWPLVLVIYGAALSFLFTLEHECTHKTPFGHVPLNEWVGRLCGVVILLPFEWFRYFHLAHHRWTNIPGKDPELAGPRPDSIGSYLRYTSGLPYWKSLIRQLVRNARGKNADSFVPDPVRPRLVVEARWMLALYAAALASLLFSPIVFWLWILPALIGQPFVRLYLLAEHGQCPPVANMFENTRTTFTSRLVRFFAWNMPFHAEHHIYPAVPFHKLPELHQLTEKHLQITSDGYVEFNKGYVSGLKD